MIKIGMMFENFVFFSGYHYNYGGHFKEMREYCTLAAVRQFHKEFYHPENCCLIVCGHLLPEELFEVRLT
jgi:Zn-dependent M16 (insulinase) family peptidase